MGKRLMIVMFLFLSLSIVATAEIGFSGDPVYTKETDSWYCKGYAGGVDHKEILDWSLWRYDESESDYVLFDAGYIQPINFNWSWGYGGLPTGDYMIWIVAPSGSEKQKTFSAQ